MLTLLASEPAHASPAQDFAKLLSDHDEAQLKLFASLAVPRNDRRYLARFDDNLTTAHLAEERRIISQERTRLAAIDRKALSEQDRLSYDIFAWTLAMRAEEIARGQGELRQMLPLNQFEGPHLSFAREIAWRGKYPYMTVGDYRSAISRMGGFARWIDSAIARMREGLAKGIVLPRVIVERLIPQVEQFVFISPEASLFMGPAKNIPARIKRPDRERIATDWARAVRQEVLPAYRRLLHFLTAEYRPKTRASLGFFALPEGRALYLHEVRERTTLELAPPAIHAIGLREVQRIEAAMVRIKNEAGFSGSLDEFRDFLRRDSRFRFRDAPAMLAAFERARRTVRPRLPALFGRIPKGRLEFRLYEPFLAPTKSTAEYSALSADGRRPGIVYVNGHNLAARSNYTTDVLALHEGLPGHHFQTALAVENKSLPLFRRYGGPSAFTEGWAQYAESLGPALGLYTDRFQKFGALAFDAWRSARLVVDTGIHWDRWHKNMAIKFLLDHSTLSAAEAEIEVERYIAVPAQALAYKIGELEFLDLKRRAQNALARRFDIRRFHDELLKDGAMPLLILRAKMERWIAREKER